MPDFFDMVQCPDCGDYVLAGTLIRHSQSHSRVHRSPAGPVVFYPLCGTPMAVAKTPRGIVVDIEA